MRLTCEKCPLNLMVMVHGWDVIVGPGLWSIAHIRCPVCSGHTVYVERAEYLEYVYPHLRGFKQADHIKALMKRPQSQGTWNSSVALLLECDGTCIPKSGNNDANDLHNVFLALSTPWVATHTLSSNEQAGSCKICGYSSGKKNKVSVVLDDSERKQHVLNVATMLRNRDMHKRLDRKEKP